MDKIKVALDAAHYYRSLGLVPLPSRMDAKRPTIEYSCYRNKQVEFYVYSLESWRTTNLQIMTGCNNRGRTKIVVVDLDGPASVEAWKRLCASKDYKTKRAWITETGSGGLHIYFSIPAQVTSVCTRVVWALIDPTGGQDGNPGFVKHSEIRLLGDSGLVVAPPSIHTTTGKSYRWKGKWNPEVFPIPENAPSWLLSLEAVKLPTSFNERTTDVSKETRTLHRPNWRQTVDSIGASEKLRLAKDWGVRFVESTGLGRRLIKCHAIGREDKNPSASFNTSLGVLSDYATGRHYSFPEIGIALGVFQDFKDAMDWIDHNYGTHQER